MQTRKNITIHRSTKCILMLFTLLIIFSKGISQTSTNEQIAIKEKELYTLREQEEKYISELEVLKLNSVTEKMDLIGQPYANGHQVQLVKHSAMQLGYNEKHEQAEWVMHMVTPDVIDGNVSRTNDFREDSLVTTGTSSKADYWYSGFDRGHLAPSADFRWSQKALSESYFYSNMSPQRPELNREKWAELENVIRDYVITNKEEVYVITGPILHDSLPEMKNEGRLNQVSIPEMYYKIVIDITGDTVTGIAFLMPNGSCGYPVMSYATSIDKIEQLTGYDFFPNLPSDIAIKVESNENTDLFKTRGSEGEIIPFNPTELPKGKINTVQAQYNIGTKSCVCGTVVSTKFSEKSGATFLNLDKKFPNQIFSVTIWEKSRNNFSYKPEEELYMKKICLTGKLESKNGTPTMNITNEKSIEILEENDEN
ncbi:MAG: endonuclease G [Flavobacteriales bacterium]